MKRSVMSQIDRFVMWRQDRLKKKVAKELYNKLWRANNILLWARHAQIRKNRYGKYHDDLERLCDELERTICKVKNDT